MSVPAIRRLPYPFLYRVDTMPRRAERVGNIQPPSGTQDANAKELKAAAATATTMSSGIKGGKECRGEQVATLIDLPRGVLSQIICSLDGRSLVRVRSVCR